MTSREKLFWFVFKKKKRKEKVQRLKLMTGLKFLLPFLSVLCLAAAASKQSKLKTGWKVMWLKAYLWKLKKKKKVQSYGTFALFGFSKNQKETELLQFCVPELLIGTGSQITTQFHLSDDPLFICIIRQLCIFFGTPGNDVFIYFNLTCNFTSWSQ